MGRNPLRLLKSAGFCGVRSRSDPHRQQCLLPLPPRRAAPLRWCLASTSRFRPSAGRRWRDRHRMGRRSRIKIRFAQQSTAQQPDSWRCASGAECILSLALRPANAHKSPTKELTISWGIFFPHPRHHRRQHDRHAGSRRRPGQDDPHDHPSKWRETLVEVRASAATRTIADQKEMRRAIGVELAGKLDREGGF